MSLNLFNWVAETLDVAVSPSFGDRARSDLLCTKSKLLMTL